MSETVDASPAALTSEALPERLLGLLPEALVRALRCGSLCLESYSSEVCSSGLGLHCDWACGPRTPTPPFFGVLIDMCMHLDWGCTPSSVRALLLGSVLGADSQWNLGSQ